MRKSIIEQLKDERIKQSLTLDQLGEKVGMAKSYISNFERGKVSPNLATIEKIATALGFDLTLVPNDMTSIKEEIQNLIAQRVSILNKEAEQNWDSERYIETLELREYNGEEAKLTIGVGKFDTLYCDVVADLEGWQITGNTNSGNKKFAEIIEQIMHYFVYDLLFPRG